MQSIVELYIFCLLIILIVFGYFYIVWRGSNYRHESQNSFLKVHIFLIMESVPHIFRRFFNKSLGMYGEYLIFRELEKIPGHGKILTNLYLPQRETVTDTELDVLFVHESGIYIIESKSYSGWIYGNENDLYWTEKFSRFKAYQFYNPLRQNYSHRKSLEKILPKSILCMNSMVVFTNNATLKKLYCPRNIVINRRDLKQKILHQSNNSLTVLEIDTIAQQLFPYKNPTQLQEKIHTTEVNILQSKKQSYFYKS